MKKILSRAMQAQFAMNQIINAESARDLSRNPNAALKAVKEYFSLKLTDDNGKSNDDGYINRLFEDVLNVTGVDMLGKHKINLRKRIMCVGEYNYSEDYKPQRTTRKAIADYLDCTSYEEAVDDAEEIVARMEEYFNKVLAHGYNTELRALSPSKIIKGSQLVLLFGKGSITLDACGNNLFSVVSNTVKQEAVVAGDLICLRDTLIRGNYVYFDYVRRYTDTLGCYITNSPVVDFAVKQRKVATFGIAC